MLMRRRSESLDHADLGWLKAKHHFRVSEDGNPAHQPLGSLIVWNDDEIAADSGFPLHGHRDTEIITYVRQGTLKHRDTLGTEAQINAGDIQVMSAGSGIRHAEFNAGPVPLKLYQIWLKPRERGLEPRWQTGTFAPQNAAGRFVVLASGFEPQAGALPLRVDARLLGATLNPGERILHTFGRPFGYLVVASGRIAIDGEPMRANDGVAITRAAGVEITAFETSELVMVETG